MFFLSTKWKRQNSSRIDELRYNSGQGSQNKSDDEGDLSEPDNDHESLNDDCDDCSIDVGGKHQDSLPDSGSLDRNYLDKLYQQTQLANNSFYYLNFLHKTLTDQTITGSARAHCSFGPDNSGHDA